MDIDIDLPKIDPKQLFGDRVVLASMTKNNELVKHPAGVYFQNMPIDPVTSLAAIPFDQAEELEYFKIDLLHLTLLDELKDLTKSDLRQLSNIPPNWDLLQDERVVEQLFQLKKHFVLLLKLQPKSIEQLADCISLLRPAKRPLIDKYIAAPNRTRTELYKMPLPPGCFKRGHAIAYALTIVVQLHLIEAGIININK